MAILIELLGCWGEGGGGGDRTIEKKNAYIVHASSGIRTHYSTVGAVQDKLDFNCVGTGTGFSMNQYLLLFLAPQPSLGLSLLHKIRLNFLEASQQFSFLQGRVVSPTPNPHPGGPGLCIYIPQRLGGYPLQSPLTTCMGYGGTILIPRSPHWE
jgi:hypothetical protein